jgi:hypothetical protein
LWKVKTSKNESVFEKNKKLGETATLVAVSVFKMLAKVYRSIDIMKRSDKITNKMINQFVKSSYKLIKGQDKPEFAVTGKLSQSLTDAQTASNSGDSKKISSKDPLGSNAEEPLDDYGQDLR